MAQYLVMLSHSMDDIPVALFDDKAAAVKCAKRQPEQPSRSLLDRLDYPECSTPICISVVTFGKNGRPTNRDIVTRYEDCATT